MDPRFRPVVTRFAPSPTGRLHLGHAHAALFAERAARSAGGRFLLRIEDIDPTRCKPEHEDGILEDLAWLGVRWDGEVRRQSEHVDEHALALARLLGDGLLYPCACSRTQVQSEVAQAAAAPHGPPPAYPGTCRRLSEAERRARMESEAPPALRLDVARALATTGPLEWSDRGRGAVRARPELLGDVVLARKEVTTSYHLAVTLDDAAQGITLVTRGEDLFDSTHVHRLLQALLGLDPPEYHHHPLLAGDDGRRLAKRAGAPTLASFRQAGRTAAEVRTLAGFA